MSVPVYKVNTIRPIRSKIDYYINVERNLVLDYFDTYSPY